MVTDAKNATLIDRMKAARKGTGLTQAQFAGAVQNLIVPRREVSNVHISRYETGAITPPLDMLLAMAQAAGVAPGWLAFGDL